MLQEKGKGLWVAGWFAGQIPPWATKNLWPTFLEFCLQTSWTGQPCWELPLQDHSLPRPHLLSLMADKGLAHSALTLSLQFRPALKGFRTPTGQAQAALKAALQLAGLLPLTTAALLSPRTALIPRVLPSQSSTQQSTWSTKLRHVSSQTGL